MQLPSQFYHREPAYTEQDGNVRYLDGKGLSRPVDLPARSRLVVAVLLACALAIGIWMIVAYIDATHGATARSQASVEENLTRGVTYDLPDVGALALGDNAAVTQQLADAGYTTYQLSDADDPSTLQLVKLPADVSAVDAAAYYARGVANLDAADAALLLNGSWTLDIDRTSGIDVRVKYADFTSGSVAAAIQDAIVTEGFDPATTPAENGTGVDEAGNAFQTGTWEDPADGTQYTWRISAIELSSVYNIDGLPDTAVYVGIRLSA